MSGFGEPTVDGVVPVEDFEAIADCSVCEDLERTEATVLETEFWKVDVGDDARYVGRCYVSLKEHVGSMPELSFEQWVDLKAVMDRLEEAARQAFGADLSNWSALMNG